MEENCGFATSTVVSRGLLEPQNVSVSKFVGRPALAASPSQRCFHAVVGTSEFGTPRDLFNPHRIAAGKTLFLEWLAFLVRKRCKRAVGTDGAILSAAHRAQKEVKCHDAAGVLAGATDLNWADRAFI